MESRSQTKKSALVLLSGGLDSATCLALAAEQGFRVNAISFDYGQRHSVELAAARNLAVHYKVDRHTVVAVPSLSELGGSALTSSDAVPKHVDVSELGAGIPSTYVPARNLVFLSLATATAEVARISDIFIGVNAVDYSGYPDCRSEFIEAFASAATLGTKQGTFGATSLKLHTPLIQLSKAEIIRLGQQLGVPYELTHSCYDPHESLACGHCDSCLLRLKGFAEAGASDPIPYSVSSAAS